MKKFLKRIPLPIIAGALAIIAIIFASGPLGQLLSKPAAASGSLAYGETRTAERVLSTFKSESYTRQEKTSPIYDAVGATLSSEDDVFFIFSSSLWYSNGEESVLVLGGVNDIAGCDENGIYVVEQDDAVTPVSQSGTSGENATSISHYNPVEGTVKTILPGAQAGFVSGNGGTATLFYAEVQPEEGEHDYRWVVKKMNLAKKESSDVFADDYIESLGGGSTKAAVKADFTSFESHINIRFSYAYGGGQLYSRWVRISGVGAVVGDSTSAPIYMGDNISFFQNNTIYENHVIDCGSFTIKMSTEPETGLYSYTAVNKDGKETLLGASQKLGVASDGLFYYIPAGQSDNEGTASKMSSVPSEPQPDVPPASSKPDESQEPPSTQTPPEEAAITTGWMVYNGKESSALQLEGGAFMGEVLEHNGSVYLLGQYRATDTWAGKELAENLVALYSCTPDGKGSFATKKLFVTKTLGTVSGIEGPYMWEYAPSYTACTGFVLVNTSAPTNILIYNLKSGKMAHIGPEDFNVQ